MPADAADTPAKGGSRMKTTLILVLVVAVVEGLGFFMVAKFFGGSPDPAYGADGQHVAEVATTQPGLVEIELLNRFKVPNKSSGRLYIYDLDVVVSVPTDREEPMRELVKSRMGALSDCVARVIRSADPEVLDEPELKTLRLQMQHALLGVTRDEEMINQVLIPRCVPMRAD